MMNYEKWLPLEDTAVQEFLINCKKLYSMSGTLEVQLANLMCDTQGAWQDLSSISDKLGSVGKLFSRVNSDHRVSVMENYLCTTWKQTVNRLRLSLMYLTNQVVNIAMAKFLNSAQHLVHILRLVDFFDILLAKSCESEMKGTAIVSNLCPSLLLPMRKLSLTRILQIIANQRSDDCGHQLVHHLVMINQKAESMRTPSEEDDYPYSDNSSMEIYRELTQCITPPAGIECAQDGSAGAANGGQEEMQIANMAALETLISSECQRIDQLLQVMAFECPTRLGPNSTKLSKSTGDVRISSKAKYKITEYYQEILWGLVGTKVEHLLIWKGMGRSSHQCKKWLIWLREFINNDNVPSLLKPSLQGLVDGLCVHFNSVMWDAMFRRALVSLGSQHSRHMVDNTETGTRTGELLRGMFEELVFLSNSCEGSNWTVAGLEELPLAEQIPILHRLDHSIHTARLWAEGKGRKLANMWNIEQFLRVTQSDVSFMIEALSKCHFANQLDLIGPESSVHVTVCGKMRAKLVSEVNVNIEKLQYVPKGCLDVLADVCRTYSLATLKIIFPEAKYWKQHFDEIPQYASSYVESYLEDILRPVLEATTVVQASKQQPVSCLILDIMCEAWLDHIYNHRIKFSEWGALQLLADFGAVPTWLVERANQESAAGGGVLVSTEALRRCEGVGRLLLSNPGHRIPVVDKKVRKGRGENEVSPQRMPPEMYVPNQTKWMELRAPRQSYFSLCCSGLLKSI